jgi:hypothetical protein
LTFGTSGLALPPATAEAQTSNPVANRLIVPIAGTVDGVAQTLTGTLAITRFATQQNQLVAIGTLTATVRDATGNIVRTIVSQVTVPVTTANGTCTILHLQLGPLDLNVLGLLIHLDRIVLDISAQPGGGLLGDLLCAIAGLLDPLTLGQQLVNLLNQILAALARL